MGDYGQYDVPKADEMINFKVGQPAPAMLPLDKIREAATIKFAETDPMFLQYGVIKGYPKFRKALAQFLTKGYQHDVDPEKIFVTNGVTGGLALICSLFLQSGDLVFMEEPSYFLALSIMKDFKINVRQIRMDEDGLDIDELERLLKRGIVPKMLYTIPTCHNPTGRTLSIEKRKRLVELSVKYGFIVVADEVYQLLSFPHVTPPPPMFTFDTHDTVLALGSFSKILAPALRLGWIQGSHKLLSKIEGCGQLDSSGGISPVISGIVHAAVASGLQQQHLDTTVQTLWGRADALMKELKTCLPAGVSFEVPDGGYFVLVRLPEGMNANDLLPIAQKHKVMFLPGASFSSNMKNYLRLSFSWYDLPDMQLGARRLADAIRDYQKVFAEQQKPLSDDKKSKGEGVRVAVHGHNGRLGSLIVAELNKLTDNSASFAGPIITRLNTKSQALDLNHVDVIVDVTLPAGTKSLISFLTEQKDAGTLQKLPALVVGTTGSLPMEDLEAYSKHAPVALRSNFSVGVPLVAELLKTAAFKLPAEGWNVEVTEIHHTKKLDAPSGTAKTLVKSLAATGAPCLGETGQAPTHSLRLGDEIGQHTVLFAGPGERIEIKHQATRREVFAIGAVRIATQALSMPLGLHLD
ncbi:aminotransferase [Plasmopara halstedii]|uniref:Aminotransferase n=1 Tax=Plasmopara halstedii TaxID=4781 RepID=A0A0P1B4Z1_PLAHL|nr:aminotransferase [Plasmopara halstedii]CEG49093.1 aminotransferase [Plasmopara halstedii]|eukprot:XP_024585462.1 aminotransferase [Plasmopara halstedii]